MSAPVARVPRPEERPLGRHGWRARGSRRARAWLHGWPGARCWRALGLLVIAVFSPALSGCALPSQARRTARLARTTHGSAHVIHGSGRVSPTSARTKVAVAERTHEYPAPPPPPESAPAADSPQLALLLYATVYINWNAGNVAQRLRALAHASVGQARSAMQLEAAQVAADPTLRAGGIANHGVVEGIAPLLGAAGKYLVITREWTTASASGAYQGLLPAWHVTLAAVSRERRGWVVSSWQPES